MARRASTTTRIGGVERVPAVMGEMPADTDGTVRVMRTRPHVQARRGRTENRRSGRPQAGRALPPPPSPQLPASTLWSLHPKGMAERPLSPNGLSVFNALLLHLHSRRAHSLACIGRSSPLRCAPFSLKLCGCQARRPLWARGGPSRRASSPSSPPSSQPRASPCTPWSAAPR